MKIPMAFVFLAAAGLACGDDGTALDSGPAADTLGPGKDLRADGSPAHDAGAPATGTVTGLVKTYTLGASHTLGYGLAYDPDSTPHRLYAADNYDNKIYAYSVSTAALSPLPAADIDTKALHASFTGPRGLAYAKLAGTPVLFALTSSDPEADKTFATTLWKINLEGSSPTLDSLDLGKAAFGLQGAEAFGLAYRPGQGLLLISYDTSRLSSASDQVRRGILMLRIGSDSGAQSDWAKAKAGDTQAVAGHIPHSGRKTTNSKYLRAPAFGLAAGSVGGHEQLFGTSYNKYLYAAHPDTGRGLFHWSSPGKRAIVGLAFGDGHLWALDRVSGPDQVHKVRVAGDWGSPVLGQRRVRRLSMVITSTATAAKPTPGVTHNFAIIHPATRRPAQGVDEKSHKQTLSPGGKVSRLSYDPAGDTGARQEYFSVSYTAQAKTGDTITSKVEADFWTSSRRHYVYPHLASKAGTVAKGYLADAKLLYGMDDKATYDKIVAAVKAATAAEYGAAAAASKNPYWIARDVMEFLLERYTYGNVSNSATGHYSYNPANLKLALLLDGAKGNEKMSCSTSTFAMSGVMRYLGIPTRWVGTSKRRSGWDKNSDGLRTPGEDALDTSFHRWPEVWLGPTYGWQRFDPTPPDDGPRELSQYELMAKAARGVGWTDLVLTLGSGLHEPFMRQKDGNQRYNMVPRYVAPLDWADTLYRSITWSNPCALKVTGPATVTASPTVTWTPSGRWDLDPTATLSVALQELTSGGSASGTPLSLATGIPYASGSKLVSLAGATKGKSYQFVVRKEGDTETGAAGVAFTY